MHAQANWPENIYTKEMDEYRVPAGWGVANVSSTAGGSFQARTREVRARLQVEEEAAALLERGLPMSWYTTHSITTLARAWKATMNWSRKKNRTSGSLGWTSAKEGSLRFGRRRFL